MSELSGKAKNAAVMKVINHPAFYGVPFDAGRMIAVEEAAQAAFDAARAEGPAPVSAPLDREGVVELREALDRLMRAERASAKAEREALVALRFESSDLLVKLAAQNEAGTEITASWEAARNALAKADAILALSQQDQVGLTTPAVLGEPSADAWIEWKGGENPAPWKVVDFRLRSGRQDCGPSNALRWAHVGEDRQGHHFDIIAYRVISPPPPAGGVK